MATSTPISSFGPINNQWSIAGTSGPGIFGTGSTALSLAGGMTAGIGADGGPVSNPPLPLVSQTGAAINPYGGQPNWPIKRIGVMRNVPGSLSSLTDVSYLYFIYNPNQIGASFLTNISQIPAQYLYGGEGSSAANADSSASGGSSQLFGNPNSSGGGSGLASSVPNLTNGQTVSWSLIFDRTYEMMYGPNPGDSRGVLKDAAALYALMGTFESTGAVPISTPVQVIFGQNAAGQTWGFTGYITSVNITYGIFRYDMMPSRCEIDLTMMTTYVAPQVPSGGGSGSTAAAITSSSGNSVVIGGNSVAVNSLPPGVAA